MKKIILLQLFIGFLSPLFSQSIGVGTATPNSSAALDISSTSKGMLIPRLTTAQRNSIVSPATGLLIINLDDQCMDMYDGANWIKNCGMKINGTDTLPSSWKQIANFGGVARYGAVGFSIGTKGYVGTGTDGVSKKDLWEYDPATNVWAQKADFAGTARSGAVGFSISNKGYLGTGSDINGAYKKDFWEYDPASNVWTQKTDFGGFGRTGAVAFTAFGDGYIACGSSNNNTNWYKDIWGYSVGGNSWYQLTDFPFYAHSLVGFSINNFGYVGIGWHKGALPPLFNDYLDNSFYEFNPAGFGTWTQVTSFPGLARHSAVGFAIGNYGYVGTGFSLGGIYDQDFWEYSYANNTWTQKANFGGTGRSKATGFVIGNKGYVGTGLDPANKQDFWEFDPFPLGPKYENTLPQDNVYSINDGIWTKEQSVVSTSNKVDIKSAPRTGTHPSNLPLYVTGAMSPAGNGVEFRHSNGTQGIGFGYNTMYATGSDPSQNLIVAAKGTSGNLIFSTNGSERMRIQGNGDIGIGTTNPLHRLQVMTANDSYGLSHTNGNVDISTYASDASGGWIGTLSNHPFNLIAGNGSNQFRLLQNGNIGIGNTTPANKLDVGNGATRSGTQGTGLSLYVTGNFNAGGNGVEFRHENGTQGIGFGFNTMYAAGSNLSQDLGMSAKGASGNLIFSTNAAERMRINESGKVGIGTSSPNAPLQFSNDLENRKIVLYESSNNDHQYYGLGINGYTLRYQVSSTSDNHIFYAGTSSSSSTELMRIQGNGNVGLGNSNPAERLHVGSYSNPANTYLNISTTGGNQFKAGIKLRHYSDAYGWTLESDEPQSAFNIKRHFNDVNGFNALSLDYLGNMTLSGLIQTEAFIAPSLLNGFSDYGNGFASAGYYKDKMGRVCLRGLVTNAGNHSGLIIFTLPVGYRPSTTGRLLFIALANSGVSRIDILADGSVQVTASSSGWISLDGISFKAD